MKHTMANLPMWALILFYAAGVAAIQMLATSMTTEAGRLTCAVMQFFLTGALLYGPSAMRRSIGEAADKAAKLKEPPAP